MNDVRVIKKIFVLLLILLMGVSFFAAICESNFSFVKNKKNYEYNNGWRYSYNGEDNPIVQVPCNIKVKNKETINIYNALPMISDSSKYFCFLSANQDIKVYIDDELIYDTLGKSVRPFGNTDGARWHFIQLIPEYSRKSIVMEISSPFTAYSGRINNIYIGTEIDIYASIFREFGFSFAMGVVLVVVAIIFLAVYIIGRISKFIWSNYLYLSFFTMGVAVWLICESRMGQVVFNNMFLIYLMNNAALMLLPMPILLYTNDIEKGRFGREINLMCWIFVVNFIAQISFQVTNICDFPQMVWITHILIIMILITVLISLYVCYKETEVKSIKNNFEGLLALMFFFIAEAVNYYFLPYNNLGNYVSVGVGIYVVILSHGSTIDRLEHEREKILAVSQNQAKTNFLARMSHEIRTPMNAIIGMNDMILNENINEDVRKYAINIKNSANVMMSILSDVLDFSKIENGKMEIINVKYKLFNLLRDVIGITNVTANNKRLKFVYEIGKDIPSGYIGDEVRIRQVMLNILNNAVKYTDSGQVTLRFNVESNDFDACFVIEVEDTGIGIKEEELGKIFDTFQRLDSEKTRKIEGFGLGLAITKQLLDLMNGSIEIKSEYGKGSTFIARIPQTIVDRTPMDIITEENIVKNSSQKNIIEGKYEGKRILAVDDNEVNLQVVAGLLKASNVKVDGVLSGEKCLTAMARYKYDLVLMDHRMPGMDGVETLKYIRGNEINRNIPVIALTANAVEGAREDFLAEGFDDYISKPISAKKFYAILDMYLAED